MNKASEYLLSFPLLFLFVLLFCFDFALFYPLFSPHSLSSSHSHEVPLQCLLSTTDPVTVCPVNAMLMVTVNDRAARTILKLVRQISAVT